MEKLHNVVYTSRHLPTGRYYIGVHSTDNLDDGYLGSGKIICNLVNAHPPEEFERQIHADFPTREQAIDLEAMLVQPFLIDKGFFPLVLNCMPGGSANTKAFSGTSRQRMSAAKKGKPGNNKGTTFSEQACKNMSNAQLGKKQTQDHKHKVSVALKGKPKPPRTAEHTANFVKANLGRKDSAETRERKRLAGLKRWASVRAKRSAANL
jgi:hypothetical protein